MKKIKTILIGLGNIGALYDIALPNEYVFSHARAFNLHPHFELVAGIDSNSEHRQIFRSHYHCSDYEDIQSAASQHHFEVAVLAVPTQYHLVVAQQLFDAASPRILLCEKPLAYRLEEAKALVELCEKNQCELYVNYMRRSDPGVIEIKERIMNGKMKGPFKGVVWYSKGFFNNASHFLNLLLYWLGNYKNFNINSLERIWQNIDPEPDLSMEFENGKVFFLAAKEECFSHYSIELIAENGRLNYQAGGRAIQWQGIQPDPLFQNYISLSTQGEIIQNSMQTSQMHVVEQLYEKMSGHSYELCSGNEAMITMKICDEIKKEIL